MSTYIQLLNVAPIFPPTCINEQKAIVVGQIIVAELLDLWVLFANRSALRRVEHVTGMYIQTGEE